MSGGSAPPFAARAALSFGNGAGKRSAGRLEHLALIVRAVLDLVVGGDRLDLAGRELRPALLPDIAEREQRQAVAGLADLAIDPEATLQLRTVEMTERPGERPFLPRRRRLAVGVLLGRCL